MTRQPLGAAFDFFGYLLQYFAAPYTLFGDNQEK